MNSLSWNDMVFSNRNQSYGAYLLRKAYPGRVTMSFAFAMITVTMLLASPMIKEMFEDEEVVQRKISVDEGIIISPPPPIEVILPPPTKADIAPPKTIRFVPPKVTDQNVDEVPPLADVKAAVVSTDTGEGTEYGLDNPIVEAEVPVVNKPDIIHTIVEQQPEFPGGYAAMMKFISANTKYPSVARRLEIEGTAFISFVVDSDGTIDDVQVMRGLFEDCDKEAMRVISKMPLWKPGRQSGQAVKVRFVLPFKFKLEH